MKKRVNHMIGLLGALALIVALGPGATQGQTGAPPFTSAPQSISGTPNGTGFTYQGQLLRKAVVVLQLAQPDPQQELL